jgi:SAM-dependent methyltransferase
MSDARGDLELTAVERWLAEHAPPERLESARGIYELMPSQSDRTLADVYVPVDARNSAHWSDLARIADYAARVPEGARWVLDVGPGDGWPSLPLAQARTEITVVGLDPSPVRARVCAENAARLGIENTRFLVGDADRLPFGDASLDAVVAASSLEEATDPDAVIAELARVLRPGGVLRISYQDWRLPAPELETVMLWDGVQPEVGRVLLYTYVRRVQLPGLERRYTLVLPVTPEVEAAHREGLVRVASARRVYGETLLEDGLGVPLLERLALHALRSTVVEMRRWDTEWLVRALERVGFASVGATAFPGDVARAVGRDVIASGVTLEGASFRAIARGIGRAAGALEGRRMVLATR